MTKITVQASIAASVTEVWRAYTTPADIIKWNAASDDWHTTNATGDLRPGGEFCSRMEAKDGSEGFDFTGTYTKVVTNELIEYSFGDRIAQIAFAEADNGTNITVVFDPETVYPAEMQRAGWQAILDSFKRHVEAA